MKAYILCRFALESQLYKSWLPALEIPYEVVEDFPGSWTPPDDCAIVVTHMHYRWDEITALRRIYQQSQIPILILADGILEYRNLFEHPDLAAGAVFQPLIGHKLACLGRGQARILESWGNVGKCEVVGLPRLDPFLSVPSRTKRPSGDFRLLICSANKPAFNDQQRAAVIESLTLIKSRFDNNPLINGRSAEIVWRLTDGLDRELGLPEVAPENLSSLADVLDSVDAVITTPSTIFLESALRRLPTAVLDFHNTPHFVPAAWMINAPKHLNAILSELAAPPAPKLLFQDMILHDQLECNSPATPRLLQLIQVMAECGKQAKARGQSMTFPSRILTDPQQGFAPISDGFSLSQLFPNNPVLQNPDLEQLQLELNLLLKRVGELPDQNYRLLKQLEEKNQRVDELQQKYNDLKDRLDAAKDRLSKWRTGVFQLKKNSDGKEIEASDD